MTVVDRPVTEHRVEVAMRRYVAEAVCTTCTWSERFTLGDNPPLVSRIIAEAGIRLAAAGHVVAAQTWPHLYGPRPTPPGPVERACAALRLDLEQHLRRTVAKAYADLGIDP